MLKPSPASIIGASRYCCNSDAILLLNEALLDTNLILTHVLLLDVDSGRGIDGRASLPCSELTPKEILY